MSAAQRYDFAIIPCTKAKNPNGKTARTLYSSAGFSLMMRHAMQRAREVYIMSAKYGFLLPDAPVEPYDAYLGNFSPNERLAYIKMLRPQLEEMDLRPQYGISYLSNAYFSVLMEADWQTAERCARPFKSLNMMALFGALRREIRAWPNDASS